MITTDSNWREINEYLAPIREILNKRAWDKVGWNENKLRIYFNRYPLSCINSTMLDSHYTQDEIDAMREEYDRGPEAAEESRRAEVQRQKFEHQKRYKIKMKKKGYK